MLLDLLFYIFKILYSLVAIIILILLRIPLLEIRELVFNMDLFYFSFAIFPLINVVFIVVTIMRKTVIREDTKINLSSYFYNTDIHIKEEDLKVNSFVSKSEVMLL